MEKITKRQMFMALLNFANDEDFGFATDDGVYVTIGAEDIATFAENELRLLDNKNAKAKEIAAKKKTEADELTAKVANALGDDFEPIADITARIEDPDVTVAKVTYRLRVLVEQGLAEKQPIKIPGSSGKKTRTIQGYKRI